MAINEKESILKLSLQDDEPSATGTPALRRGYRETWQGEEYLQQMQFLKIYDRSHTSQEFHWSY